MRNYRNLILILSLFCLQAEVLLGQFPAYYQHSVLSSANITGLLIGESSGERAYHHIVEMAGYARLRQLSEFDGDLMETAYLVRKLQEYGIDNFRVERFGTTKSWQGVSASLWEISPTPGKIADLVESPLMLASGSQSIDTIGEIMYADATMIASGFNSIDVKGKIILTGERPNSVLPRAMQAGAAAIISFYSPRPLENSSMIPSSSAGGRGGSQAGTVFMISPRDGESLLRRVLSREKIIIRAQAEVAYVDAELQVTSCLIEGSDPGAGEIIISAHIFEGYVKTGGNDNISGSAAILEAARVLNKLIEEGSIPRPARSIRFIWVPEFSGTVPWVAANRGVIDNTLCNINLDMVGLSLSEWRSFFVLHRTSYGNAHYVGDVVESLFRYTGETNKVNSVVSGSSFFRPIVAPTGTTDPFYYQIESASGGSDHMVFNDLGVMVPGILMITWPDPFYHTSEDLADKCDPTQLKRTVFITAGSAYAIAAAGKREAAVIAGEVASNSLRRMGIVQSMVLNIIATASPDEVNRLANAAIGKIRGAALGEVMILNSVKELAPGDGALDALLASLSGGIVKTADEQVAMVIELASSLNRNSGLPAYVFRQSSMEKDASKLKPVVKLEYKDLGYRAYQTILGKVTKEELAKFNIREIADPQEALKLADGAKSILDIKYILDAQYSAETSLEALTSFFMALERVQVVGY